MRIIDQIHELSEFTPTEREIAIYLEENSKEAVNLSLDELSAKIFVSKSTVIRFCKKLGFKGHKELCVQLAKEISTYLVDDRRIDASFPFSKEDDVKALADKVYALNYGALVQTYQELDLNAVMSVAKAIRDAKRIFIYALDENSLLAMNFAMQLQILGMNVTMCTIASISASIAIEQGNDSIAMFINYRSKDFIPVQTAKILLAKSIPMYLITGPFKSGMPSYLSGIISTSIYESTPKVVSISSRNSIMLVLDLLFCMIYAMDLEKNEKSFKEKNELAKSILGVG